MRTSASLFIGAALCAIALSGCDMAIRQDMADQPKNRPQSPSKFFSDGRSERPLIKRQIQRFQGVCGISPAGGSEAPGARRGSLQGILHAVPRITGRWKWHGGCAGHETSAELSH